jgi:hypothetical protein
MSLPGGIFPALSRGQGSGVVQLSHSHYSTRQFVLCLVTQIETAFSDFKDALLSLTRARDASQLLIKELPLGSHPACICRQKTLEIIQITVSGACVEFRVIGAAPRSGQQGGRATMFAPAQQQAAR